MLARPRPGGPAESAMTYTLTPWPLFSGVVGPLVAARHADSVDPQQGAVEDHEGLTLGDRLLEERGTGSDTETRRLSQLLEGPKPLARISTRSDSPSIDMIHCTD